VAARRLTAPFAGKRQSARRFTWRWAGAKN